MTTPAFSERLSGFLAERGDKTRLSELTGLSPTTISRYCWGDQTPGVRNLNRLVEGLRLLHPRKNITADKLLEGE